MLVGIKDPVERAIVHRTAQSEHLIGPLHIPPGAGALEPNMTNELVSRLDPPAADGIASLAGKAIVHPSLIIGEVPNQLPDLLSSPAILILE